MSLNDDDEQTHQRHTCTCGAELERTAGSKTHTCTWCEAEYDIHNRRIWPDDPWYDLQQA